MKRLVLEVLTTKWGKMLRIKEQTHRGDDFNGCKGCVFASTNGFGLLSKVSPSIETDVLYVRGSDASRDNDILVVPSLVWLTKCAKAVKEYNESFREDKVSSDSDIQTIE